MKKRTTSRGWWVLVRFWDKLCAWGERFWRRSAWSSSWGEGPDWVKRLRRYPSFESLENRQLMATASFASSLYGVSQEGDSGTKTFDVTVQLTGTSATGSVYYSVVELAGGDVVTGTYEYARRASAPSDFTAITSGVVTFGSGETQKTFSVTVKGDITNEGTEIFKAVLTGTSTSNILLSATTAFGVAESTNVLLTIVDDDPIPLVKFSSPRYTVTEGNVTKTVTVVLDRPTEVKDVLVDYKSIGCGCGGSAPEAGVSLANPSEGALPPDMSAYPFADPANDYTSVQGTVKISKGSTSGTFSVPIRQDTLEEGPEDVGLRLSNPQYALMATPRDFMATMTIIDDDVTIAYDGSGNVGTITFSDGTTRRRTYSGGNLTALIDERSQVTTITNDGSGWLQSVTDPTGRVTSYTVDSNGFLLSKVVNPGGPLAGTTTYESSTSAAGWTYGAITRLTTITFANGAQRIYGYDAGGNVTLQTDELTHSITYGYDATTHRLTSSTDSRGTTTYTYDSTSGFLQTVKDPLNRVTSYGYDTNGRMTSRTAAGAGTSTTYAYDSVGRVTSTTDPLGRRTTTTYDSGGRVLTVARPDPDGGGPLVSLVTTYGYDTSDGWSTVTSPDGTVTTSQYDRRGRLTASIDAAGATTVYAYDQASRQTSTTAPGSSATLTKYDNAGRVTETVDVSGRSATTMYDSRGRVSETRDVYGSRTTFGYDALDRRVTVTNPDTKMATTAYDLAGRVTSSIDIFGNTTLYGYDPEGRQTRVEDADHNVTTNVYDSAGQLTETRDWYNAATTYAYDSQGRQTQVSAPDSNVSTTQYDAGGQVTATIDPYGQRTTYQYDGAGRQTAVLDVYNHATTTAYDSFGRVTSVVDILGHSTTSSYDGKGRVTTVQDVYGNKSTTTFDAHNRVSTTTDGHNRTTTTAYDGKGRVTAVTDALGTSSTVFDGTYNRVSTTIDRLGGIATTLYDDRGRVTSAIDAAGRRTTSVYDSSNRVTETADTHDYRTTTQFDARGRYTATVDARGNVSSIAYDGKGRQTTAFNALQQATTTMYDDRGRVTETVTPYGASGAHATVIYDGRGRVTAALDALGRRTTSVYDARSRVSETIDALGSHSTAVYDSFGRVSATVDPLSRTSTMQFDDYGRAIRTVNPLGYGGTTVYDSFGRVTASIAPVGASGTATTVYAYDDFDRRISVTDPGGNVTTSAYDALGRETQKTAPGGSSATFAYDRVGRLTSTTDNSGRVRAIQYDQSVTTTTFATVETHYSAGGTIVNDTVTWTFDKVGNQLTAKNNPGSAGVQTQTMVYDALNRVTHTDQVTGVGITFSYDVAGNRTAVADSQSNLETSTYDAGHQLTRRQTSANDWIDFQYDLNGREVAQMRNHIASGSLPSPSSNPKIVGVVVNGGPVSATDANGKTPYLFGQNSIVTQLLVTFDQSVTLDSGAFTITNLNSSVTVTGGVSPSSAAVTVSWSAVSGSNNTQYVLTFGGGVDSYSYAGSGGSGTFNVLKDGLYQLNTVSSKVHNGAVYMSADRSDRFWTLYGTTSWDDKSVSQISPSGVSITNPYASSSFNMTVTATSASNSSSAPFYFAGLDRNLNGTISSAEQSTFTNTYYNTIWEWNNPASPNSLVAFTVTTYDAAGQVTQQTSGNGSSDGLAEYKYSYDAAGQVTQQTENGVTTTFAYDSGGQVTGTTNPRTVAGSPVQSGRAVATYAYDAGGNRSTLNLTGTNNTTGLGSDALDAISKTYTTGTDNKYTADGEWNYSYDALGNLTGKTNSSSSDQYGIQWTYTYDNLNRLTKAERDSDGDGNGSNHIDLRVVYKYDANGNRVSKSVDTDGDGYNWTAAGQFASTVDSYSSQNATNTAAKATGATNSDYWTPSALNSANEWIVLNFATSAKADGIVIKEAAGTTGNGFITRIDLIESGGTAHTVFNGTDPVKLDGYARITFPLTSYNVAKVKIFVNGQIHSSVLPAIDSVELRRHSVSTTVNGSAVQTNFTLDGWNPAKGGAIGLENVDVWTENIVGTSNKTHYTRGDRVDQLLGRVDANGTFWALTDKLGSVRGVVDNAGLLAAQADYDAFGNVIANNTNPNSSGGLGNYGWTGREREVEAGLQYNRARYYDPAMGRWISKDPLGFDAGDSNLYRYVKNAPTNNTDPSGEKVYIYVLEGAGGKGITIGKLKLAVNSVMSDFADALRKKFPNAEVIYEGQNGADRVIQELRKTAAGVGDDAIGGVICNRNIVIGYSSGGDAVTLIANKLDTPNNRGLRLDLAATIDPVPVKRDLVLGNAIGTRDEFGPVSRKSVDRWINYYEELDRKSLFFGLVNVKGRRIPGADAEYNLSVDQLKSRLLAADPKDLAPYAHSTIGYSDLVRDGITEEIAKIYAKPVVIEPGFRN